MKIQNMISVLFVVLSMTGQVQAEQIETLSLGTAEQLALQQDNILQGQQQQVLAMQERSVAADNWPDPMIRFGAVAVPVDTFDLEQEQMTQVQLGYRQMLPRGDSAQLKSKKFSAKSNQSVQAKSLRERMVKRMLRKAWLKVYFTEQAREIIQTNRKLFKQLVEVSQSQYVAGRKKQQDVLQAEVELSMIEDDLERISSEVDVARAGLAKWIGATQAGLPLEPHNDYLGELMLTENQMSDDALMAHPQVVMIEQKIRVAEFDESIARENSGTRWGFDISYGIRQGDNPVMVGGEPRADFINAMALVSIPFGTEDNQDRIISASQKMVQAKRFEKQDKLLELKTALEQSKARWYKLIDRISLYEERLIPNTKQNASAALNAYQTGVGSFIALTRARVSEFKAQLSHLKLIVEKARVLADIRYLAGEEK